MGKGFKILCFVMVATGASYFLLNKSKESTKKVTKSEKQTTREEIQETIVSKQINKKNPAIEIKKEVTKADTAKEQEVLRKLEEEDTAALYTYIEQGGNPNIKNDQQKSLLAVASELGDIEAVDYLIKSGAKIDSVDDRGSTPTMNAIMHSTAPGDYKEIVEALVEAGADVNHVNKEGVSPLHLAIMVDDPQLATTLLKAGAVQVNNVNGQSPLMEAAQNGSNKVINPLIQHGANPNQQVLDGRSALHMAIENDNYVGARLLAGLGASEKLKDNAGKTARDYASVSTNEDIKVFFSDER